MFHKLLALRSHNHGNRGSVLKEKALLKLIDGLLQAESSSGQAGTLRGALKSVDVEFRRPRLKQDRSRPTENPGKS